MRVIPTDIQDLYILEPEIFGDRRGWFFESWSQRKMEEAGITVRFVQDNHSYSARKGTLRGLHLQKGEAAQAKLVRCVRGAVYDVAVDLREGSPTYRKWAGVELSAENYRQLFIPRGFAHGFLTLRNDTEFLYKADNFYTPEAEAGIRWDDPELAVDWGEARPILNAKDSAAPFLRDCDFHFPYPSGACMPDDPPVQ
ncbi:MAG: dTDP-4-dehydrorhamnose 3,5-epimerase [Provencibacterium sp.]|nr:dTDP-4-dehydrorhamnose 3,5-epimerase [Provencibacterium sp.]